MDDDGYHDDLEDLDDDNDTVEDLVDNCQYVPNPGQHNRDYKLDDFGMLVILTMMMDF